jgi:hypothetical protein
VKATISFLIMGSFIVLGHHIDAGIPKEEGAIL